MSGKQSPGGILLPGALDIGTSASNTRGQTLFGADSRAATLGAGSNGPSLANMAWTEHQGRTLSGERCFRHGSE
jgi:hypothetical protein